MTFRQRKEKLRRSIISLTKRIIEEQSAKVNFAYFSEVVHRKPKEMKVTFCYDYDNMYRR